MYTDLHESFAIHYVICWGNFLFYFAVIIRSILYFQYAVLRQYTGLPQKSGIYSFLPHIVTNCKYCV